ncbi:MAG: glycosyltransferase family 2 protein [Paracoccaceae bacterium]|nr:glycosyltransferase family 2 protein [Paracoccaceae bacterium]
MPVNYACVASIITVSDHKVGKAEGWAALRETYKHLAAQDYREPVEFLLVETEGAHHAIPEDIKGLVPDLRIVTTPGTSSFDLKNAGAAAARSDFVIILDADCRPAPGWWRAIYEHRLRHPEAAVISGRTFYEGEGVLPKVFAVIDRTYVDAGESGPTHAISNNNAGFSRQILLDHPFSNEVGPFGSEPHAARVKASGAALRFESGMLAYHAFTGWDMVREERRHIGFSMTRYRQLHPDAARGWMVKYPPLWTVYLVAASTASDVRRSLRFGRAYGLKWFHVPYLWLCSARTHLLEIPGIRLALSGEWIGRWNAYR